MEIHPTSEAVIKTVARKLRYYMDVRRRELDFDLSGPQKPRTFWKEPSVQDSVAQFFHTQHDRHVKHYFRHPEMKRHLQYMECDGSDVSVSRESSVRLEIEDEMDRLAQVADPVSTRMESVEPSSGRRVRRSRGSSLNSVEMPRTSTPCTPNRRTRQRTHSTSRLMHQRKQKCKNHLTPGEAERLLSTASKLIVATETVVLNESGRDWSESKRSRDKSDEESHLPSVDVTTAWTHEPADSKPEDVHLTHLSGTHKDTVDNKGHRYGHSSNHNNPESWSSMMPLPPPRSHRHRSHSFQSLSDSALYQRRLSTFSQDTKHNLQHQHRPANAVMKEKQQNADNKRSGRATTDIETAVSLMDGQHTLGSEREESTESSLVDVEMERMSDMRESEDEEQQTVEDDVQVIDLQEESGETDKGSNKQETFGDDVTTAEEDKAMGKEMQDGKMDRDFVEGDNNKKHIKEKDGDVEDSMAVEEENEHISHGDSVGEHVASVTKSTVNDNKFGEEDPVDTSSCEDPKATRIESASSVELHPVMVDAATQTSNDKSTQTSDDNIMGGGMTDSSLLESISPEKIMQEAGKVLKLLQGLPSLVQYELELHTGQNTLAGTSAAVQVVLFGDAGNSGIQHLNHSSTHEDMFQPGNVDVFTISCSALGKLKGVKVWHDNTGTSPSWFLEKIVVREGKDGIADFVFDCSRWLTAEDSSNCSSIEHMGTFAMLYCTGIILKGIASQELESALLTNATRYFPESMSHPQASPYSSSAVYSSAQPSDVRVPGQFYGSSVGMSSSFAATQSRTGQQPVVIDHGESAQQTQTDRDREDQSTPKSAQAETSDVSGVQESRVKEGRDAVGQDGEALDEHHMERSLSQTENEQQDKGSKSPTLRSPIEVKSAPSSPQHVDLDQINETIRQEALKQHLSAIKLQQFFKGFVAGSKASKTPTKHVEEILQETRQTEEDTVLIGLQRGPSVHQAAKEGNLTRLESFLNHNVTLISSIDEHGWSPLHEAAAGGHTDCVKLLVTHGAKLDEFTPTGYYPIHLAAMNGHIHCLQLLMGLGCNLSQRAVDDQTPLHLAASRGLIESCRWLIANRANLNAVDSSGRTPLDIAKEYDHQNCVKLIEECKNEIGRNDSGLAMLINMSSNSDNSPNLHDGHEVTHADTSTETRVDDEQDNEGWLSDDNFSGSQNSTEARLPTTRTVEEKRALYEKQQLLMIQQRSSFLDSIRQEIEGDLTTETEVLNGLDEGAVTDGASSKQTELNHGEEDKLLSKPAESQGMPDLIDEETAGQQTEESGTVGNFSHANSPELEGLEAVMPDSDLN